MTWILKVPLGLEKALLPNNKNIPDNKKTNNKKNVDNLQKSQLFLNSLDPESCGQSSTNRSKDWQQWKNFETKKIVSHIENK